MPKYNPFHNASDNFSDKRDYSETICGFFGIFIRIFLGSRWLQLISSERYH